MFILRILLRLALAILFVGGVIGAASFAHHRPNPAHATVIVESTLGHGSGVSIGNGYILTAAHVVDAKADYKVTTEDGQSLPAEVLWLNKEYDVAMLHVEHLDIGYADLACREPKLGERVEAVGNPLSIKFVHTYGQVGGLPRPVEDIKSMFIASLTVVPGMSGGPVFDSSGYVLGLVSAVMNVPTGMMTSSLMPVSFIIPSAVVCGLLGRNT